NVDTLGGTQATNIISESGLYHLILTSRTEQARPFRRWVTHDVLPTLRRTGRYHMPGIDQDGDNEYSSAQRKRVVAIERSGRVFQTTIKVARAAGQTRTQAVHTANAAACDATGV